MRKQSLRLLCMLLALVMAASLVITGAPMHAHAAEDIVVTVGASGCQYTTINAALDAIAGMSRSSGQRAVIEIQPGNYEEMLRIDLDNITLRNASATPSIALKNKGVDIDANAVRITSYYGHGYNYYSMNSDYLWDADTLAANKAAGKASVTNSGGTSSTHWNATVVISGDNFIAEDIIFENSFNQYVSAKAANDVIVDNGSAKEGSTPRGDLPKGSTAVQDKKYVERAAALAIKNNAKNAFFDHCKFVGRQDTLYGGRPVTAAFYDCEIYGACDYIFGGMTAVFAKCDLVFNTSEDKNDKGYITAAQTQSGSRGMLFYNCHITSTTPGVDTASSYASKPGYFGRPWAADTGEAIFYYTVIDATCSYWSSQSKSLIQPVGWLDTLKGESKLSGEYGTVELSGVNNSSSRESWATGVNSSGKLYDGKSISVSTFLGSWNPFSGKDMTIVTDGTVVEPEETTPEPETTAPSGGGDIVVPAGSYVHNFTENGKTSDFYTITGNTSTSKGTATYNGLTLTTCLKMESSTNISFTAPSDGTLTLVFGSSETGKKVKVDGADYTTDSSGMVSVDIAAGSHTIVKGDSINLFYMVYSPEGSGESGGESGGETEDPITATGSLNMSNVTVTKAAGAADPTTVDASLLSGLTMTVSYSDGTSATIALSDLVISNIKSHDTLGNYIDVDYNDPVTGAKVHCYILVTIEETSGDEGGGETEDPITATGALNMSNVTVTKAAGAADPTAVDASLLSGLAMTVSYSDGTSATIGLSDLVISNIKSHDTLGNYIDVDYNDPVTGTKVHCYILVAIEEESGSEGGGESGGDVVVPANSQIHNFTDDGFTSTFYTFAGGQVTNGKHGTFTHDFGNGTETLNYALKFDSGGSVTFTPTADGTLTIAVASSSAGRTVVINNGSSDIGTVSIDTAKQLFVLSVDVTANVTYTVKRSSGESGLYYIAYIPASSGGDVHTHNYTETITTAATCTADGVKTFTCSCGDSYTETIAATGHTEVTDAAVAATCTTAGKTEGKHCSVCNTVLVAQQTVAATGHSYSSVVTAPTCTEAGVRTHTCSTCGHSYSETIAATGHTEVTDAAVAATCTTAGKTEGKHCSVCNEVLVVQQTVPAKGHTNAAAVKENEKPASCAVNGSYESVVYCSVCDAEISRNTVTVPATGAHVYATESQRKDATCTEDGYVIMACGCGATQQTTLKAPGHTEVIDAAVAATCTTAGKTEGKHCSVCNTVLVAQQTVAAKGHNFVDGLCTVCGAADPEFVAGVTVSGNYVSAGVASDVLTIQLIAEGETEAAYVFTNEAAPANTGSWSIEGVAQGKYTVLVMKKNHVTREYELTVTDGVAAVDVQICLLGDVDGNGKVNYTDYINLLAQAKNPAEVILTGYIRQCADITGEGTISYIDYLAVLSHAKAITSIW